MRNNPILALSVVLLAIVLLVGAFMLWTGRDGQMRDAEADFAARLRAGELAGGTESPSPKRASTPEPSSFDEEAELEAWYAASGESGGSEGGSARKTARP